MENVNFEGLEDAIQATNDLLKSVKSITKELNKGLNTAKQQSDNPQQIQTLQAKVNRLINKALRGEDVTADINKLTNEFKDTK